MLRLSVLLSVLLTFVSSASAQDFEEFLGVDLVRPTVSDQSPELAFRDRIRGRRAKIKLLSDGLWVTNDQDQATMRLAHDAPHIGMIIEREGIGFGTAFPNKPVHVYGNGIGNGGGFKEACIKVENTPTMATELRTMFQLVNNGPARFEFENTNSDETWTFQTNASDNFMINRLGSGGNEFSIRKSGMITMGPGGRQNFVLQPNGNLAIAGAISQMSDRNQKTAIERLNVNDVLERVNQIPITSWQYKDDDSRVRHIGPMAQDFFEQFSLGDNDKAISSIDSSGVALAAIQALSQQLEEKTDEIDQLRSEMAEIRATLAAASNE